MNMPQTTPRLCHERENATPVSCKNSDLCDPSLCFVKVSVVDGHPARGQGSDIDSVRSCAYFLLAVISLHTERHPTHEAGIPQMELLQSACKHTCGASRKSVHTSLTHDETLLFVSCSCSSSLHASVRTGLFLGTRLELDSDNFITVANGRTQGPQKQHLRWDG